MPISSVAFEFQSGSIALNRCRMLDTGMLRDLDAVGCRNIPLRPAARSFADRGPPSKGEKLDPGPAFYQQPRYITPSLCTGDVLLYPRHKPPPAKDLRDDEEQLVVSRFQVQVNDVVRRDEALVRWIP